MTDSQTAATRNPLRDSAIPVTGESTDYDALMELVGDARIVLLGEATHGTHEFYRARAEITKRLIAEKGFNGIAIEADWPAAYRVNRYVRGESDDASATDALGDFSRFPSWMWRNTDVREFVTWLHDHNARHSSAAEQVGFYGLDLYSLYSSIDAVITYLDGVDPEAASRARARYSCFEHVKRDPHSYGYATALGELEPCEDDVVEQLIDLQRRSTASLSHNGSASGDDHFFAEQNARVVVHAERYYRSMFRSGVVSWNLRDRHMAESLDAILAYLAKPAGAANVVVWAHNSHLGDARATERTHVGELNLGQLTRDKQGNDAILIGFTTHGGTVTAASDWGDPAERMRVRPAIEESYEALLHQTGLPNFFLSLRTDMRAASALHDARLERAIGVIYRPESERRSHYFEATLPDQFDALFHFDETTAVEPLERTSEWDIEPPETYPFAE